MLRSEYHLLVFSILSSEFVPMLRSSRVPCNGGEMVPPRTSPARVAAPRHPMSPEGHSFDLGDEIRQNHGRARERSVCHPRGRRVPV
jgi:hypothetical protein